MSQIVAIGIAGILLLIAGVIFGAIGVAAGVLSFVARNIRYR